MRERMASSRLSDIVWMMRNIGVTLVCKTIPVGLHARIAHSYGWISTIMVSMPKCVRDNLESALGSEYDKPTIHRIARDHLGFRSRLAYMTAVLRSRGSISKRSTSIQLEGIEHLDAALALGKGALLITSHYGYCGLAYSLLRSAGYQPRRVVARSSGVERIRRLREWVDRGGRLRKWISGVLLRGIIETGDIPAQLAVRSIVCNLSENKPITMAGDGLRDTDFVIMKLLGQPFPFPLGYAKLALMTGAPVLPVFVTESDGHCIKMCVHEAIPSNTGVREIVRAYASILQERIEQAPHLWRRWHTESIFESAVAWSQEDFSRRFGQSFSNWAEHRRDCGFTMISSRR